MTCQLTLQGQLQVGGSGCGCGSGSVSQRLLGLDFACPGVLYQSIGGTDCQVPLSTAGAPGDVFVDLPNVSAIARFALLALKTTAKVVLRLGAEVAELLGSGGTFPTGFAGGETFAFTVDGVAVAVTFTNGAQSAQQVANQINAAAALAGLAFLPASVQSSGQLALRGQKTGVAGSVAVTTANATIGYPSNTALDTGAGQDVPVNGLFITQFDPSTGPTRIQISGSAQIEVLAAGSA